MRKVIVLKEVQKSDCSFLYELLSERKLYENISHKKNPTYTKHIKFVMSKPYTKWYIIYHQKEKVGSIYLTKQDEIGISINNDYEYAQIVKSALRLLMKLNQRKRYLANVGPKDVKSQEFLLKNGFSGLEYVYEIKK